VSFPSLGYGHFRKPLMAASTRWSFRLCDLIVPLHKSLEYAVPTYHDIDGPAQGIRHFCKDLRTPIEPLGYGFDSVFWNASGTRLPKRFITVASNAHKPYIQVIKGLDMITQVAPRFPDCEFLVVGAREGSLPNKPSNVIEVPFIPNEELPQHYGRASFYLQLSVSEGFGNALCEAMLCGCIPIVSAVGAMPEIVGDSGEVVGKRNVDVVEASIKAALACDRVERSIAARTRIVTQRPESLRKDGLITRLMRLSHM
jgi:glycosyltransferase involved in cell wall biosynthesis